MVYQVDEQRDSALRWSNCRANQRGNSKPAKSVEVYVSGEYLE